MYSQVKFFFFQGALYKASCRLPAFYYNKTEIQLKKCIFCPFFVLDGAFDTINGKVKTKKSICIGLGGYANPRVALFLVPLYGNY